MHLRDDSDVERVLVQARPAPSDEFVAATERDLLGRPAHARRGRRSLFLAGAITSGLATLAIGSALIGSGPLSSKDDAATASPQCRTVVVTRMERQGEVVLDRDGNPTVVYRSKPVKQTVKRCRR